MARSAKEFPIRDIPIKELKKWPGNDFPPLTAEKRKHMVQSMNSLIESGYHPQRETGSVWHGYVVAGENRFECLQEVKWPTFRAEVLPDSMSETEVKNLVSIGNANRRDNTQETVAAVIVSRYKDLLNVDLRAQNKSKNPVYPIHEGEKVRHVGRYIAKKSYFSLKTVMLALAQLHSEAKQRNMANDLRKIRRGLTSAQEKAIIAKLEQYVALRNRRDQFRKRISKGEELLNEREKNIKAFLRDFGGLSMWISDDGIRKDIGLD